MTEKDRYELKIAGLLHDCGKVTTPVHVVDKATKLETIFDRIHLIDTRFEVLKRDAEIESLQKKLAFLQETSRWKRRARTSACATGCARSTTTARFLHATQHRRRAHARRGHRAREAHRRATAGATSPGTRPTSSPTTR